MKQLEINTMHSFRLAKSDMIKLNHFMHNLHQNQETLLTEIAKLKQNQTANELAIRALQSKIKIQQIQPITIVEAQKPADDIYFVASKNSKKFHEHHCAFAHNINPKNKVVFETEDKARKTGRNKCVCAK